MMLQPNSTTVQATTVDIRSDTSVQNKSWVTLVIVSINHKEGPQLLSVGELLPSFTFEEVSTLKKGDFIQGDIEVLGDASHRTYQLSNIALVAK